MSSRLVSMLALAGLCAVCVLATWFTFRDGTPAVAQATATRPGQAARAQGVAAAGAGGAGPRAVTAATVATDAAREAPVLVMPLFDASARLEVQRPTTLRFRARRASGDAATGVDLALAVVQGSREPIALAVRDAGEGLYDAEFVPPGPGEFMALVTVRGQPTRSVRLGVVGAADDGDAPGPNQALSAAAGRGGRGHAAARRGR